MYIKRKVHCKGLLDDGGLVQENYRGFTTRPVTKSRLNSMTNGRLNAKGLRQYAKTTHVVPAVSVHTLFKRWEYLPNRSRLAGGWHAKPG